MSTKTTFKRVALVAVAALGLGVMPIVSAQAAFDNASVVKLIPVTLDTSTTSLVGRVGQQVSFTPTGGSLATAGVANSIATVTMAVAVTSQPVGSSLYASLTHVATLTNGANALENRGAGLAIAAARGSANTVAEATAGLTDTGSSTVVGTISYSDDDATAMQTTSYAAIPAKTALGTVTFTPTVAGVYTVVVWNETSRGHGSPSAANNTAVATSEAGLSGAESFQTFTVNVVTGIATVAISAINSTSAIDAALANEQDDFGSLVKVTLKDAAGNLSIPAIGETVILTPSSATGDITYVNNVAVTSAKGAAYSLSAADFGQTGTAYVNITNSAAATYSVVATYTGTASASVSLTTRTIAAAGDVSPIPTGTTGWVQGTAAGANNNGNYDYPTSSASGAFYVTSAYSATTASYVGFKVTDTLGLITGLAGAEYNPASTVVAAVVTGVAGGAVSISWTGPSAATNGLFTVANLEDVHFTTIDSVATTAGLATVSPGTINAVPGAAVVVNVTLKDNFKRAMANQTMNAFVTGRNPTLVNKTALTDALGNTSFTFTDVNTTSVIVADTISVTGGTATVTSTVLYGTANAPATITLTSTGDTDVIAGTTETDIDAGAAGATGTSATASAVVKNSAGSAVAGVAVTFTVTGLVGAEVHTTKATVYTDATGTAASNISSYAAGMATVTATAGAATATDNVYFSQQTPGEARTIAISAVGGLVKATVKDRYGNTIEGVVVNATRTGTGYFGAGASTATGNTDSKGEVEFNFIGSGTVTVALSSATYGQSYAAAGFDADAVNGTAITAYVAGTSATNQKGLGGSLSPAGINSASLAVEGANAAADAANAAADAAAEAIDAANAATDAANLAAEAADAATVAAEEARDAADAATAAVEELATQVATLMAALKAQITTLANTVAKIAKKVKA